MNVGPSMGAQGRERLAVGRLLIVDGCGGVGDWEPSADFDAQVAGHNECSRSAPPSLHSRG